MLSATEWTSGSMRIGTVVVYCTKIQNRELEEEVEDSDECEEDENDPLDDGQRNIGLL